VESDDIFLDSDGRVRSLREALAENYDPVFRFLRKISSDEELARDLAQDVMVKAIKGIRKYRGDASFRTWLLSIAVNSFKDTARVRARKRRIIEIDRGFEVHDDGKSIDMTNRRIDAERARDLLSTLPLKQRQALVLKLDFGYSYEELARVLGCPIGTIRSRIHSAMEELRRKMGEQHGK
jgi:RNA polymerase sigma-70 factor, ECF subfamily